VAYDPAFAFEISYIVKDALRRMYGPESENIFYYLTVYNEPFPQPPAPAVDGLEEGVLRGLYRYREAPENGDRPRAQILASGSGMLQALRAQELLAQDWGVAADVWSATSWNELRRDAVACDEHNLLRPGEPARTPWVSSALDGAQGPVVAVSDFMRAVPDQIARWVPQDYASLGTDGFGRSDTRAALRRHFHVDGPSIVVATLEMLARRGAVKPESVNEAVERYQLLDDQVIDGGSANEADDQPVSG
jgi:pyruvate dehydrogenase E1 component